MHPPSAARLALAAALCSATVIPAQAAPVAVTQADGQGAVQVSPGLTRKSILRGIEGTVGRFNVRSEIDLGALGSPGAKIQIEGTSESQLILGGEVLMTVTNMAGAETVGLLGASNGTGKLFSLSLDGDRTAISYADGDVTGEGALVLEDPFKSFRSATMYVEQGGMLTKVFLGPDWKQLAEVRSVRADSRPRDVLADLLTRTVPPAAINRKDKEPDPARNYSPEHERLAALVGDFVQRRADGEGGQRFLRSRLIGNGRYLMGVAGPSREGGDPSDPVAPEAEAPEEERVDEIWLLGFDSTRRVYQYFHLSGADGPVQYCEGPPRKSGDLVLRDLVGSLSLTIQRGEDGVLRSQSVVGRAAPVTVLHHPAPSKDKRAQ